MGKLQRWASESATSLYELVTRWPQGVVLVSLVVALFSVWYAAHHLRFLPNFAGLSREDSSFNKNYADFVHEFRVEPDIMVVAKGPSEKQNEAFLDELALHLKKNPYLTRIYYKVDLRPFKAWALAYPDYATLKKIASTINIAKPVFKSMGYRADLTQFWLTLPKITQQSSQMQGDASGIIELKALVDLMTARLQGKKGNSALQAPLKEFEQLQETQYITLKNGQYALMFARPATTPNGEAKVEEAVLSIRSAVNQTSPQFPKVEAHLTGEPVLGVDEMQTAKHDILWAGIVSLLLCSTILIVGFGDLRKTILTVISLFVGIGWSLGYIALSVGHLNVFTLSLFPMLIGLAIDFSIQFLGRFGEERARTNSAIEAVKITYFSTGTGLFTAAVITALGFLAIAFTEYKGIAELGVATGGSLLLCFLSTMTVLPALLIWSESKTQAKPSQIPVTHLFHATSLEKSLLRHAKLILLVAFLATIILGEKARDITFDHNILNLQAKNTDSIKMELELLQVSDKSSLFAVMVASNPNEALDKINQLRKFDTVGNIQSPLPFVPADQKKKLPVLHEIRQELKGFDLTRSDAPVDVPRLANAFENIDGLIQKTDKKLTLASGALTFLQSFIFPGSQVIPHRSLSTKLGQIHWALDSFRQSVVRFGEVLKNTNPRRAQDILTDLQTSFFNTVEKSFHLMKQGIPNHPVTLGDLPPQVRDQFVGKTGKIMIQVFPSQNIWDRPALERFINQLREVDPNVTGSPVLILETTRIMLESYQQAAKIAFFVIVIVAFLQFRKVSLTLFTLMPLAIGLLWLMGIMVLFHRSFNPANLLTLPVILGIGVAFGVYVVNRYREERHPSIFSTSTGRSVLLSALTTIAGFASLLGVSHQGLQSLGFTMTVGLFVIALQALVVLPAALEIVERFPKVSQRILEIGAND